MYLRTKSGLTLLAVFLGTAGMGLPAALQINGTCEIGSCAPVDVLQPGDFSSGIINLTYTFANSDSYLLKGTYSTSNSAADASHIQMDWTATYAGNSTGTASQSDTFTLELLEDYNLSGSLDGYYFEDAIGFISSDTGAGSSFAAQLIEDGQSIGLLGPFTTPGYHSASNQQFLSGLTNPLASDLQFGFKFGEGSQPGSLISTLAPEPAEGLLMLSGLVALALQTTRSRRRA